MPGGFTSTQTTDCPIDVADALDRAGGDQEFLKELVEIFLEDVPERLAEIKTAVAGGDADTVAKSSHSIKGAAANLSAVHVRETAFQIEQAGRDGDVSGVAPLVTQLEAQVQELASFAETL